MKKSRFWFIINNDFMFLKRFFMYYWLMFIYFVSYIFGVCVVKGEESELRIVYCFWEIFKIDGEERVN